MMRYFVLVLLLAMSGPSTSAQFKTANLRAEGFTCALCSNVVYKALVKLPFIDSVSPDVEHASFLIHFREGSHADPDAIRKAVENAGFNVGLLKMNAQFRQIEATPGKTLDYEGIRLHFFVSSDIKLDGERSLTFMDKGFVTLKEFRKTATGDHAACLQSGRASQCRAAAGLDPNSRIYHVSL
jgi:copper chaperone CopZ